jgi:hypothetical protein
MKKIGEYTAKGTLQSEDVSGAPYRLILFDGRFDTGYRVTDFQVSGQDVDSTSVIGVAGKIMTVADGTAKEWTWGDSTEIAWAQYQNDHNLAGTTGDAGSWIDPDNLVIEDLYVYLSENADGICNYMIKMEKYEFSDWRGALAMVRNRGQG